MTTSRGVSGTQRARRPQCKSSLKACCRPRHGRTVSLAPRAVFRAACLEPIADRVPASSGASPGASRETAGRRLSRFFEKTALQVLIQTCRLGFGPSPSPSVYHSSDAVGLRRSETVTLNDWTGGFRIAVTARGTRPSPEQRQRAARFRRRLHKAAAEHRNRRQSFPLPRKRAP
jgi:hypothetical protein